MKTNLIIMATIGLVMSFIFGISGIQDAPKSQTRCHESMARGEYIFPAYRIGCWLGSVPK